MPYTTQKSRFHKIDMDFGFVASTLKSDDLDLPHYLHSLNVWQRRTTAYPGYDIEHVLSLQPKADHRTHV